MYLCSANKLYVRAIKGPFSQGLFYLAPIAAVLYELAVYPYRAFKKGIRPYRVCSQRYVVGRLFVCRNLKNAA